jgi:hypothetical protein
MYGFKIAGTAVNLLTFLLGHSPYATFQSAVKVAPAGFVNVVRECCFWVLLCIFFSKFSPEAHETLPPFVWHQVHSRRGKVSLQVRCRASLSLRLITMFNH